MRPVDVPDDGMLPGGRSRNVMEISMLECSKSNFRTRLFFCVALMALSAPVIADQGKVTLLKGSASRVAGGLRVAMKQGGPVFPGDRIETGKKSFITIQFDDGTRFSLGEQATLQITAVDSERDGIFSASVLRGAFRFVTGLIAKRRPAAMQVKAGSVATIGIRGTTVGGEVDGDAATIVLLPNEDVAQKSAIEVGNAFGQVIIEETGYGTRVPDAQSPPSAPTRMTLRTIENLVRNLSSIQRNAMPRPRMPH
jgi:hypothetical protein